MVLIVVYLATIVAANLLANSLGPIITPLTAFLFIGLNLTTRDPLHDRWTHRGLHWKMPVLITAGAALTALVAPAAARIASASVIAFAAGATVDTLAYALLHNQPPRRRANGSNIASALVDSVLFPSLAFGTILPVVIVAQAAAKIAGGFIWTLVLFPPQEPHHEPPLQPVVRTPLD